VSDAARTIRLRTPPLWVGGLAGGAAGLAAAGLLLLTTPVLAGGALAAALGGLLALAAPHAGLYLITAAMIVSWPGGLIKFAGLALTGSALLWALATRRRLLVGDPLLAILAGLTALVGLSALTKGSEEASALATSYLGFLTFYWAVSTMADRPIVVRRLVGAMLLSGLVIALIGFVQFRSPFIWFASTTAAESALAFRAGTDALSLQQWGGAFRVDSLTGTPDFMGLSMQILLPFAFFWTLRQPTPLRRAVGLGLLLTLAVAMLLSFTRGVMVSTVAIVIPFVAAKIGWRRSLPALIVGGLLVGATVAAWEPLRTRAVSTVTEWTGDDPRSAGGWRRAVWPVATEMFLDYFWTGAGIGRQRELFRDYAPAALLVPIDDLQAPLHNAYLTMAIEVGVFGLAALLLLVLFAWRRLRRAQAEFRASQQAPLLALAQAAEVAWVALAFNMAFYPHLATFRYFWVLLAVIGGLSRVAADGRARATGQGGAR
jgi:O-antigen ligase